MRPTWTVVSPARTIIILRSQASDFADDQAPAADEPPPDAEAGPAGGPELVWLAVSEAPA